MKQNITLLISQNKLPQAFEALGDLTQKAKDKKALIIIENRWHALQSKIRLGTISDNDASIESNKINEGLLSLLNNIERREQTVESNLTPKVLILAGIVTLLIVAYFLYNKNNTPAAIVCEESKKGVLIANFQDIEKESSRDPFANSLMSNLDSELDDKFYDVRGVGSQTRNVPKYKDYIRKTYFENTCDTSGLFINGLLNKDQEVFNLYATIVNMEMKSPYIKNEDALILANPEGISFSINDDAKFVSSFFEALLKSYSDTPIEAVKAFNELLKDEKTREIIINNDNLRATIAHYKGNVYAVRGDNDGARKQYEEADKYGSPELRRTNAENRRKADKVNKQMKENPEMRATLQKNERTHSTMDADLAKFFKSLDKVAKEVGRELRNIFK